MKKNNKFLHIFLILMFISVLITLFMAKPDNSGYSRYMPPKDSAFRVTFEYPSSWEWAVRDDGSLTGSGLIITENPDSQNTYSGWVVVDVRLYESPEKTKTEMNESIASFLKTKKVMRTEILSDKIFEIDGHFARQVTTKSSPVFVLGQSEQLITERIYILAENSYYGITFDIVESERHSDFGKGFDYMVESIKFVP